MSSINPESQSMAQDHKKNGHGSHKQENYVRVIEVVLRFILFLTALAPVILLATSKQTVFFQYHSLLMECQFLLNSLLCLPWCKLFTSKSVSSSSEYYSFFQTVSFDMILLVKISCRCRGGYTSKPARWPVSLCYMPCIFTSCCFSFIF